MQGKKRVSIFIGLIVISLIGISIVSASWFSDLFRIGKSNGLEGELEETKYAKATVNVTAAANPPVIFSVNKPYAPVGGFGTVDLNPSPASTSVNFSFIALEDPGSIGPDAAGCGNIGLPGVNPGDVVSVPSSLRGNFSALSGESRRDIVSCRYVGPVAVTWGVPCTAKNYSCSVTAEYYDRGAKGNFFWNMSVQIFQSTNGMWSNPSYAASSTQYFQYTDRYAINLNPSSVNWTNPPLVQGAVNLLSNNNITITNMGNINLLVVDNDLAMNATRLNHTSPVTSDFFASNNFTADDDTTPCSESGFADELEVALNVDVNKFVVGASSGQTNVTFCAKTVPVNLPIGIYESRRNWEILTQNG